MHLEFYLTVVLLHESGKMYFFEISVDLDHLVSELFLILCL